MDAKTKRVILDIIDSQIELTLATLRDDGYPQANTVSYANDDLTIYFGTGRDSQKVKNLQHRAKVSIKIDVPTDGRVKKGIKSCSERALSTSLRATHPRRAWPTP